MHKFLCRLLAICPFCHTLYGLIAEFYFKSRRETRVKIHIVQKGDTLWKIAKKYGVNFEELKKMNTQLSNPDMTMPGMKIKIPGTGGTIKKEAPIGSKPGVSVKMGAKKEMPVAEAPKEVPIKEAPKKEAPVLEKPVEELPQKQMPAPVEVPTKPFVPKMPKPIMPEIDINNYYMMNMANLSVQQPSQLPPKPVKPPIMKPVEHKPIQQPIMKPVEQKPIQQPIMKPIQPTLPQLPPKPENILPSVKPIAKQSPALMESESSVHSHKGGYDQQMYPYQPNLYYPMSQSMPGVGFQSGYPQQQMANPFVQGAMQMPMYQGGVMPMQQMQMPHYGLAGVESHGYEESSSWQMPMHQMPHTNPTYTQPTHAQMPAPVMGVEDMSQHQLPLQPTYTAPAMHPAYGYPQAPCPPQHLIPISPVMPGSGLCGPIPMPYGYPQMGVMPQVQGVMSESPEMAQMPLMPTQSQLPLSPMQSQMPLSPSQSQMPLSPVTMPKPVKGVGTDCGCDGGMMHHGPQGHGAGYDMGGYQAPYDMGGAPMYSMPYGQQMQMRYPQPSYMNPYGYGPMGGAAFGMPRSYEESSEFDV